MLNIFPSVDTAVCATSVRTFNERAAALEGTTVLNVSADLPFAMGRFCGAEGIENVQSASVFRSDFGDTYGVKIAEGPLAGLMSRAVVVVNGDGVVTYTEQVPEIGQEPDYDSALAALEVAAGHPSVSSHPSVWRSDVGRREHSDAYSPRSFSSPTTRPSWSATRLQARSTPGMKLSRS